jgi:hypothetical protein
LGEKLQIAVPYVRPMIHGTAPGGAKKFVGSRHAQITMPMKKSCLGFVLRVRISTP